MSDHIQELRGLAVRLETAEHMMSGTYAAAVREGWRQAATQVRELADRWEREQGEFEIPEGAWCPECGPGVKVDEEGLCVSCGVTAIGNGANAALRALAAKPAPQASALRDVLEEATRIIRHDRANKNRSGIGTSISQRRIDALLSKCDAVLAEEREEARNG